jgi:Ser/Thr protein kinase RdoA (MazF antagonist)
MVSAEPLSGGFRNRMFLVTMSSSRQYVVRFYLDSCVGQTEIGVLRMIHGSLPAPRVVYSEPEPVGKGQTVSVLEYVRGLPLDGVLRQSTVADLEAIGRTVGSVLADVGRIRFDRPGFLDPGLVPGGQYLATAEMILPYVEERLFSRTAESALGVRARDSYWDLLESSLPILELLTPETHLVHADFNGKNILMEEASESWSVKAIID